MSGCCQCVCALDEGVPVTGGNPSYGGRPGATIVAVLQGAPGAGGPGSCSDPHTAVTPLETQRHSPPSGPAIGPGENDSVWSRAALPDRAKALLHGGSQQKARNPGHVPPAAALTSASASSVMKLVISADHNKVIDIR